MIIYVLVYQQMLSWILNTHIYLYPFPDFNLKCDIIVSMVVMQLGAEDTKHFSISYRVGEHVIFQEEQL